MTRVKAKLVLTTIVLPMVIAGLVGSAVWLATTPSDEPDDAPVTPVAAPPVEVAPLPGTPASAEVRHTFSKVGPAARASDLPDQLRLFNTARQAAADGDYRGALAALDALELQYPRGPLHAEAELSRAEWQGDLYLAEGKCAQAGAAYRQAVALGLDGERAEAARAALSRCVAR